MDVFDKFEPLIQEENVFFALGYDYYSLALDDLRRSHICCDLSLLSRLNVCSTTWIISERPRGHLHSLVRRILNDIFVVDIVLDWNRKCKSCPTLLLYVRLLLLVMLRLAEDLSSHEFHNDLADPETKACSSELPVMVI